MKLSSLLFENTEHEPEELVEVIRDMLRVITEKAEKFARVYRSEKMNTALRGLNDWATEIYQAINNMTLALNNIRTRRPSLNAIAFDDHELNHIGTSVSIIKGHAMNIVENTREYKLVSREDSASLMSLVEELVESYGQLRANLHATF